MSERFEYDVKAKGKMKADDYVLSYEQRNPTIGECFDALINLLEKKGITERDELLDELDAVMIANNLKEGK